LLRKRKPRGALCLGIAAQTKADEVDPDIEEGIGISIFEAEDDEHHPCVGLVLEHLPLVEYQGNIFPGVLMTSALARRLARVMNKCADDVER
jgi:hypothetical protein